MVDEFVRTQRKNYRREKENASFGVSVHKLWRNERPRLKARLGWPNWLGY
jgi:hypothetical protein